jgi:type IV secretory pathway VirB2 component (pilin)
MAMTLIQDVNWKSVAAGGGGALALFAMMTVPAFAAGAFPWKGALDSFVAMFQGVVNK